MNVSGNSRSAGTRQKIQQAFMDLLDKKPFNKISVSDICGLAEISRPSFYAHYDDINDLIMQIEDEKSAYIVSIFVEADTITEESFRLYLNYIQENRLFYKAYFETENNALVSQKIMRQYLKANGLKESYRLKFNMVFFMAGIRAVVYDWIAGGQRESVEELAGLLFEQHENFQVNILSMAH